MKAKALDMFRMFLRLSMYVGAAATITYGLIQMSPGFRAFVSFIVNPITWQFFAICIGIVIISVFGVCGIMKLAIFSGIDEDPSFVLGFIIYFGVVIVLVKVFLTP